MKINNMMRPASVAGMTASLFLYTGLHSLAYSAGFQIQEQSVKGLGNAFAGAAVVAEDASTVFHNPAGMAWLPQRQVESAFHIILPRADFKESNSTNAIGGHTSGDTSADGGTAALVPNLYVSQPLTDRLTFGFGISALYGLVTEYDKDWIGRYHAVKSDLTTININPALSYQLNDKFSVGLGFNAQYASAELTNALDFGALGFLGGAPVSPSTQAFDGFTELEGDDWGFGFNLGAIYKISDGTRVGLAYRSEIDHTLEGENTLTVPDFATTLAGPSRTRDATADLTTPATFSISGYHQLNERWALLADITWTDWSVFKELRIEFEDGSADSVQPEDWQDSFRYSLGVNYKPNNEWVLRAGLAYDETPVPSATKRTPRVPDSSRTWLTLGASYQYSEEFRFDVGYAHIFFDDASIRDTEVTTGSLSGLPVGSTLDGEYESGVDIISAQVQWNF